MLEFKNVEYEELKHFKLFALDDDVLGYDTLVNKTTKFRWLSEGYKEL